MKNNLLFYLLCKIGHDQPRRDKKAFFSDQCKEIEENNRMGKTEISSRKLEIPKWYFASFHAKMGSIKDRNGRDLTEAENIKKRWEEYRK